MVVAEMLLNLHLMLMFASQVSLDELKAIFNARGNVPGNEFISKECMDSLYRVCHDAQEAVKSEEREKHCTLTGKLGKMKC